MEQELDLIGKELVIKVLEHEDVPRVPWVPFAGVHAGKLTGYTGEEVLTDGEKLLESLLAVNEIYHPDGQPVLFDLQVEAEILGCDLVWAEKAPPSVASHPLSTERRVPGHLPERDEGRLPLILDVMREMKREVGDQTALYGLICGPFTIASHLRGTEVFMDMFGQTDYLHELLTFTTDVNRRMAELYIDAGMDVIAVVDPLVSQISPAHFNEFLAEPFTEIFAFLREREVYSSFFVCGDATKNLEPMSRTEPDSISIDENIDIVEAKQITDRFNIALGGNIPLTTRMLMGTQQDNVRYVLDILDRLDHKNLIISPGCDMPYDVPPENVVGIVQAIREPERAREMLTGYQEEEVEVSVELPDYESLDKPLIEVFTLDSATCPACGYMLHAAQRAADELGDQVELVEYKFNRPENVARVKAMGIKSLPSMLINGDLVFASVIPSHRELMEEIEKRS